MDASTLMKTGLLVVARCAVVSMCAGLAMSARADVETDPLVPFSFYHPVPDHLTASARNFDSAPSVTVSPGGRLWIAWHSGGTTEGEDNAVLVATSGDGGKTWSEPLFAIDAPGPLRALDPGLWTDPDGRVWLFYGQVYSYWDGRCGVWATHPIDPEDADTAWTTPVRLCDGFMKNKPIVDSQGRWLLPVEFMKLDPTKGNLGNWSPMTDEHAHPMPEMRAANVFVSTDKGATVSFLGRSAIPTAQMDCMENMVVERGNGTLWMLSRTTYGIGKATSSDGGATWTGTTASTIKNPNSRFFIGRLRSGCLLLVKNGPVDVKTDRRQIMAYVSNDDGATWTGGLTLDARENVSYPDAAQDGDGFIHVVHDHDRTKTRQIVHHRFTEADVRAGHLVSAGSRLGDTVAVNPSFAPQVEPKGDDEDTYALLDYIDSTKGGGQYIDTGFVNKSGDFVDLKFDLLSVDPDDYNSIANPPSTYSMFGARNGLNTSGGITISQDVNVQSPKVPLVFFMYGVTPSILDTRITSENPTVGEWRVFGDGTQLEIVRPDGTSNVRDNSSQAFSPDLSTYIFAAHLANVSFTWLPHPQMRFRTLLIRRGNEDHWFLPVRTPEGKPCVYDVWERRLLQNKGTGADFALGPDCASQGTQVTVNLSGAGTLRVNGEPCGTSLTTNLTIGESIELSVLPSAGNAFLRWTSNVDLYDGDTLPAMRLAANPSQGDVSLTAEVGPGVTALEYIDSTKGGGQYVDTGFVNMSGDFVDLRFDLLSVDPDDYNSIANPPSTYSMFGARNGLSTSGGITISQDVNVQSPKVPLVFFMYGVTPSIIDTRITSENPTVGEWRVFSDGTHLEIVRPDGTSNVRDNSSQEFSPDLSAYIFSAHLANVSFTWLPHPQMRFRSLLMRRGTEEHLFLPALRGSDSKPGVYDCYNARFLENQGGGADFVAGSTDSSIKFGVGVYGEGAVSVNGGTPVSHLTRTVALNAVDLTACPAAADAECVWVGVPANGFRSESGREVAFHEIAARNVYLDVFTPSAADLVVAAGGEKGVSSMSGLRSVHVGTPTAGAGLASFTVLGQVDITAADGGYAVVRTPDGKVKTATFALLNGGRMMLLDDLVVQDIDLPDDKSVLDLNGHVLTIRSKAHKNRAGWAGKVIDSAGGGSVVWKKPGMAILLY